MSGGRIKYFIALMSFVLLLNVWQGLRSGNVLLIYRTVKKSEDLSLFWFSIIASALLAISGAAVDWIVSSNSLEKSKWSDLLFAIVMGGEALISLKTGKTYVMYTPAERSKESELFWIGVGIMALGCAACITVFIQSVLKYQSVVM